ncbi:hypothetical protein BXT86_04700 [candidate division WOR-3 bacterium 4484_100]|uniref:Cleaved adhesin domain-containing protein n=1 Tax=candidate division WOR-3 bacterium 4484_100 TaxID=1936077 RepID=A0A1V4QEJ6_UNCW3|nr:MAG: hypothetical protein BXT86_04700 [candidate division WOR-3 bacterium 4484_100]
MLLILIFSTWAETFDTQNFFPPNDWLIVNEDALDAVWYRASGSAHSGQYAAACYYDTLYSGLSYTNLDYLITPRIIPQQDDTLLNFWYKCSTTEPCTLDIMGCLSAPPSMIAFSVLQSFLLTDTVWIQKTVSLTAYNGTPVYLAFRVRRIPFHDTVRLDDISLPALTTQPFICNGRLRTKGPPSQKYLQVWGTNYEMGFAHGYLIASEFMSIYINKWIGYTEFHSGTPEYWENTYLPWWRAKYYVPTKFQEEAQGIIDGIVAKGVSLYHPALGRNLTAEDILALTGGGDFISFGCSSLSGWGNSTINDDTLQGGYIIARNVDGSMGLYTTLANSSLIIAFSSSNPGDQRFFNITMAGVFGASSCLNEHGVGLGQNTGNHPDTNTIPPNSLLGDYLSSRLAIELIDPDGNGVNDIYDIDSMKINNEHIRSNDIHLYSPYDGAHPDPGAILEINHLADTLRYAIHNYIEPPIYSSWNLAVTNHDRLLYPPVYCQRYQRIADSLNADYHLSIRRAIRIANSVAVDYIPTTGQGTYKSLVILPNIGVEHPDWPCVGVSYARRFRAAHTQKKVWYSWNELFDGISDVKEVVVRPVRNRSRAATIVAGPLRLSYKEGYRIFDITGRQFHNLDPVPGVYFVEVNGKVVNKIIKVR